MIGRRGRGGYRRPGSEHPIVLANLKRLNAVHRIIALMLAAAIAAARGAWAQLRLFFGIATGGTEGSGGTYCPLGGKLAQLISNKAPVDD